MAVPLKKRLARISIARDATAQDVIEGEVNVRAFLREDPAEHFVIHFNGHFHTFHRDHVQIGKEDLLLICKKTFERLTVTEDMLKDKTLYYNLKKLGLYGMCLASQFQAVLEASSGQYFSIVKVSNAQHVIASYELFAEYGSSAVSRAHCQEGSSAIVYEIKTFDVTTTKTRSATKASGGRNTRKRS